MTEKSPVYLEGRIDGLQALLTIVCNRYLDIETDDVLKMEGLVNRIESGDFFSENRDEEYSDGVKEVFIRFIGVMKSIENKEKVPG